MKRSGYKSVFHIYLISFILLIGMLVAGIGMVLFTITIQKPGGQAGLSNWPIHFTEDFSEYIVFSDNTPRIKQSGLEQLQKNNLWIQIIDTNGNEIQSYNKPQEVLSHYSPSELLLLYQGGTKNHTAFLGSLQHNSTDWTYIIGFPVKISKITMYFNEARFTSGKPILTGMIGIMFLLIIALGLFYSLWITKQMARMTKTIEEVALRAYTPVTNNGVFRDVYDGLNALGAEIRSSDEVRERNEKLREEWIANITHDLKTPLSPIRGYAELISDPDYVIEPNEISKYGNTILKNTAYAEKLIDDLKLTYQLRNGMLPLHKSKQNIVRFVKELVIDLLNNPEYESRNITFHSTSEDIQLLIDSVFLKRALNNLLTNALVHNSKETEVAVSIKAAVNVQICIQDNGRGMAKEELNNLFARYYRGTNTEAKPEGTGLGMAIAKQIIEVHDGSIFVESELGIGTSFIVKFPVPD